MTDREERQHVIEVLKSWDGYFIGYTSDEVQEALRYAIASIETDIRYDLLYEETSGQADKQADKPITKNCESCRYYGSHHKVCNYCYKCSLWTEQEPTTKNDLGVECISRDSAIKALDYDIESFEFKSGVSKHMDDIAKLLNTIYEIQVNNIKALPSVTPQLSSELEKNSKKLEKNFGESDCISREQALRELKESAEHHANDSREEVLLRRDRDIIRALPAVTPQEPILDRVRAEIETKYGQCDICEYDAISGWEQVSDIADILQIIDKYKAESEE